MEQAEFEALWKTLQQSLIPLDKRLTTVEARGSRAEIAGAAEAVAALPTPGQPGRLLYLTTGTAGLYVDLGTGWGYVNVTVV